MMTAVSPTAAHPTKAGIGLRARHHVDIVESRPDIGLIEIHAENYMGGGIPLAHLERARALYPVSVHGVGASLGSANGFDPAHIERLAALVERVEPALVSEHLAWSGSPGLYLNDLLPLPYTEHSLDVVAANVGRVQDALKRQILIENPSLYLAYADSPVPEPDFLGALVRRTGCGVLCDVNNIYVSCVNLGGNPVAYIDALPPEAVRELHLAGHTAKRIDGVPLLIDDHGSPVTDAVWSLYERAVARFANAVTLIEWDTDVPELATLIGEAAEADRRARTARGSGDADARAA
ncbi:MAG TPA: DUF692 domain-containing protein [Alphaproteobacteria bacterium]|nr:DUF692 domain-containing protein [Alphaproteobacteria bacterium]